MTEIIYDGTVVFCERFVDKRSRTRDQMVQAARSGRQNIAEGSRASATSSQTELRLVNVARASLDELLLDYEDYLRQRRLPLWGRDDPRALEVRGIGHRTDRSDQSDRLEVKPYQRYRHFIEDAADDTAANTLICLIHQANFLLDRQIRALERQFIEAGGYSERLAAARLEQRRNRSDRSDQSDRSEKPPSPPACPACGQPLILRTARKGNTTGSQFWGCSAYPRCTATLAL